MPGYWNAIHYALHRPNIEILHKYTWSIDHVYLWKISIFGMCNAEWIAFQFQFANARGPIVKVFVLGTDNLPVAADRRCEPPAMALIGVKYGCQVVFKD